jgi:hypothetical protein
MRSRPSRESGPAAGYFARLYFATRTCMSRVIWSMPSGRQPGPDTRPAADLVHFRWNLRSVDDPLTLAPVRDDLTEPRRTADGAIPLEKTS